MTKPVHLYGIRNCDTMKKARAWLDAHNIVYDFHDYKVEGVGQASLEFWCNALDWDAVINRAGTTFKSLPDDRKSGLTKARAIELMLANPSMIKRPILVCGARVFAGFRPDVYEKEFL